MTTGVTLLDRGLRFLGVLASGATSDTNQRADGLTAINGLLESWRNDKLLTYSMVDNSLTMVNAQQSYTVGASGDLNITRPVKFEDAFMTISSVDTPVTLIDQVQWDAIPYKTNSSSLVEYAFYNPLMTSSQGVLKVYPVPSAANVLHLITWTVLASLAAITDTVLLPPGYDRAIASNLAIEIAPEYGASASPELQKIARDSLAAIKRMNILPIRAGSELARLFPSKGSSRILTGP